MACLPWVSRTCIVLGAREEVITHPNLCALKKSCACGRDNGASHPFTFLTSLYLFLFFLSFFLSFFLLNQIVDGISMF
jgi:hypothetical protein